MMWFITMTFGVCIAVAFADDPAGFIPKDGFVPDEATAIKIAVAVLEPIYGRDKIDGEKPFKAKLDSGTWTVVGSIDKGHVGGVALVKISKRDARVLSVTHGR
jgi:hypothetical protein